MEDEVKKGRKRLKKTPVAEKSPKTTPPLPLESDAMDGKQMDELLVSLTKTPYFKAIKYYNSVRGSAVDQSLRSIDPFKEPTMTARNQGIRIGLFDLEVYAEEEATRRKKAEEEGKEPEIGGRGY